MRKQKSKLPPKRRETPMPEVLYRRPLRQLQDAAESGELGEAYERARAESEPLREALRESVPPGMRNER